MALRYWIGRILGRRRQGGWNWELQPTDPPRAESGTAKPRVTYPDERATRAKVILGFQDGTEMPIPDTDPLVKEFVKAADRMMRPARWKRLTKGWRTSV